MATGAAPFVPPVPGKDLDNVFVYRTIEDLEAIRDAAETATTGAVIGGGLLGLEAANALLQLGLETHVVEMAPRLMPVQLDEAGGATLVRHVEGLGVHVHTGADIKHRKAMYLDTAMWDEQHKPKPKLGGSAPEGFPDLIVALSVEETTSSLEQMTSWYEGKVRRRMGECSRVRVSTFCNLLLFVCFFLIW